MAFEYEVNGYKQWEIVINAVKLKNLQSHG